MHPDPVSVASDLLMIALPVALVTAGFARTKGLRPLYRMLALWLMKALTVSLIDFSIRLIHDYSWAAHQ